MFDIGISEIFVIGVVALVVSAPNACRAWRKPWATCWAGFSAMWAMSSRISIAKSNWMNCANCNPPMQDAANSVQQTIGAQVNFIESEVKQAGTQVEQHVEAAVAPIRGIELMSAASPAAAPAPAITTEPVAAAGPVATTAQDADAATGNVTKS